MNHNRGARVWDAIDAVARGAGGLPSLWYAVLACAKGLDAMGAGLSMRRDGRALEPVLATDPVVGELEELQSTLGEGPSDDVLATGTPVLQADMADLYSGQRWPAFAPVATDRGVRGLFAFPIGAGAARLGVLSVYRRQTGLLRPHQVQDALVYADAIFVLALDDRRGLSADLHEVIDAAFSARRAEVHQAAGLIAAQQRINVADALDRLRAYAYSRGRPLHEVATEVMAGQLVLERDINGSPKDFKQEEE